MFAVSWSGGKDSMLALDRAVRQGLDVRWLVNLYDESSRRVRFHGVRCELIATQASRLGLTLIQLSTTPDAFESVFLEAIDRVVASGAHGIIFGNIHLADVRAWYEERTTRAGLDHREPLWGDRPHDLVREVVERGYEPVMTSVDTKRGRREWLGRTIDAALTSELASTPGVDAAGESGEFHTFVRNGPLFSRPIHVRTGETVEAEGHALIDLIEAETC
jgi:uncharacterized protein (TIGR00290 family)